MLTRFSICRARVVFVLTAGGNENHAGLQHWLGSVGTTKLAEVRVRCTILSQMCWCSRTVSFGLCLFPA